MPALSFKKIAVRALRALFGVLAAALFLAWLLGTEQALRWGARQAEYLSGGRLAVGAVHGSLYGPLRIESLSLQTDERRFEVEEAALDWTPLALIRRHLQIDRLSARTLRIAELQPSAEPLAPPETLRLPLTFSAPAVTVERVVFQDGGTERLLSAIDLGAENSAGRYALRLRGMTTPWGKGEAEMTLDDTPPFQVSARAALRQTEGWPYRAEAEASGSLHRLLLEAKAEMKGGQAGLQATLTPFGKTLLAEARLDASGIDPARFREGWPQAALGATVTLAPQGADGLEGRIALRNALPGAWERARLPLREMTARFAGTPERLDLREIRLDLAEAGHLQGGGQIRGKRLRLDLTTENLDPRGLHGKMLAMRLAGGIRLQADAAGQELTADLRYRRFRLRLDAGHRDGAVELRQATLQSAGGRLALHGALALQDARPFQLAGALQGFNPADFGDYPAALLNASFSAAGRLAAEPQATLGFAVADSHFRHQPLSGQGSLSISATRVWDSEITLRQAGNRLELKGALGNPGDRLAFRVEAGNLALLSPELGGQAHATGALEGQFAAPSGNFEARASGLAWRKDYRIGSLRASGKLERGIDGMLALDGELRELAAPRLRLDRAGWRARGTRIEHTLRLQAKNPDFDLESRLAGGWHDESGWRGQVLELANRGRHAFALLSPAKLEVARQRLLLGDARFDLGGARLAVRELAYDGGHLVSRGEFQGLPLAYLLSRAGQASALKTDLILGGDWRIAMRDKVDGHVALRRERGDVFLPTTPQTALGIDRLALSVEAVDNRLQGRLEAAGARLGSLQAGARGVLSRRAGAWGIAGDAPLHADASLAIESLAWLAPLLDSSGALTLDGALKAEVRAGGSLARPELSGGLTGSRFTVALPDLGMNFTEGRFQASLHGQTLRIDDLALRGGAGGLGGQGRLAFKDGAPAMQLALKADKLEVLSRPDRHLVLSGNGEAEVAGKTVRIAAKLKADRGVIELPKEGAPVPSEDVVVLGRSQAVGKREPPYAVSFDLDLDLGERFFVKGKGLDAQLGGALKLTGADGAAPDARGSIHVVKGAYSAYGQRLEIGRGILNFQGPPDNPGLDIIALRKNQPVEAGVAISGTAQSPRIRLVSNPNVPDSEKLSWLVLGYGFGDSADPSFKALQAAAGALLAAGESITLQQQIAHAAGLDEFTLKGAGGLESTVLSLGKRLSSRAYVSYEQGLAGAATLMKINYTLSQRLSLRAEAGATPAMDIFYTFSFD